MRLKLCWWFILHYTYIGAAEISSPPRPCGRGRPNTWWEHQRQPSVKKPLFCLIFCWRYVNYKFYYSCIVSLLDYWKGSSWNLWKVSIRIQHVRTVFLVMMYCTYGHVHMVPIGDSTIGLWHVWITWQIVHSLLLRCTSLTVMLIRDSSGIISWTFNMHT